MSLTPARLVLGFMTPSSHIQCLPAFLFLIQLKGAMERKVQVVASGSTSSKLGSLEKVV